jgi:hypothetical protein
MTITKAEIIDVVHAASVSPKKESELVKHYWKSIKRRLKMEMMSLISGLAIVLNKKKERKVEIRNREVRFSRKET